MSKEIRKMINKVKNFKQFVNEQNLNVGDEVMLKKDKNVNQVVDDTSKDWSEWEKVDYKWVGVNDLIKGENYINPNTGDEFVFNRHEITDKNKFRESLLDIFLKMDVLFEGLDDFMHRKAISKENQQSSALTEEESKFYDVYFDVIQEITEQATEAEMTPSEYMKEELERAHEKRAKLSLQ